MKSDLFARHAKNLLAGILLLGGILLVGGCCSKNGGSGGSGGGLVRLEFWNTMEGPEARIMPALIREFCDATPGIEINEVQIDFYKARDKFRQSMKAGAAPALMRADRFWLSDFIKESLIEEIAASEISAELDDMVPVARGVITHNDKYWAIPVSVDCLAMFYNRRHLNEKNVNVPVNFDEFSSAVSTLTDANVGRYGFFIYPNGWYFEPFFFGFGGQYFAPDGTLAINSDAALKSLEFLLHLKDGLKAVPPVNLRSNVYQTMMHSFSSGQVSIIFSGPWAIRTVINGAAFKDDNANLGIAPLPEGPHGTFSPTGCQTLVIAKNSKNRAAALKFALFMFSFETQKRLSMVNFGMPARRTVFAAPELKRDPYLQTFIKQLQTSRKVINSPLRGEIYAPLGEKIKQVLNGDLTPEYALNDLVSEWKNRR
jgi:arabinogalactan oligomer/maltooligosaccharide transport system substrate-binding protein